MPTPPTSGPVQHPHHPGRPSRSARPATPGRLDPADDVAPAGQDVYVAGTVLAERYRIVAMLGKGGMGEVYRADDLTLDQPVALKFLPGDLERDARALERCWPKCATRGRSRTRTSAACTTSAR